MALRRAVLAAALCAGVVACGDGISEPEEPASVKTEAELTFLRFPAALVDSVPERASFWAVKGQNRELRVSYLPEPGEDEGDDFLEFEVPADALLRRPDGTAFQRGDSVLITVDIVRDGRFLFHFEPSGLVFDPRHPAELEIEYQRTQGDLNGDGVVNELDRRLEREMAIWKQEAPGQPWQRMGTVKFEDLDEIEAKIFGFTGFCVAA